MDVRRFQEKDRENLKKVCVETSSIPLRNEKDIKVLHLLYLEAYLNEEPESCFVAVDDNDEAVGYCICAPDFDRYKKVYKEKFLKQVWDLKPFSAIKRWGEFLIDAPLKKKYPAHLHINLFAHSQRKGLGSKLVDALYAHLKENGIKGLYLRCGNKNETGKSFYKKYGFTLKSTKVSALFVMDIV